MSPQIMAMALGYFMCSEAAEDQFLSQQQARECSRLYTQLKLAFTEIETEQAYLDLPLEEKRKINDQGYDGYLAWVDANPEVVAGLRREARVNLSRLGF